MLNKKFELFKLIANAQKTRSAFLTNLAQNVKILFYYNLFRKALFLYFNAGHYFYNKIH